MVSLQPITQSYLEEPVSCFSRPKIKPYHKGSIMDTLMQKSPLMAYFAQISSLDETLNDPEVQYTCFAPCREYCEKYWKVFHNNTDHLKARNLVLSCLIKFNVSEKELTHFDIIPSLNRYSSIDVRYVQRSGKIVLNQNLFLVESDIHCINGKVHLINGLIEPSSCFGTSN